MAERHCVGCLERTVTLKQNFEFHPFTLESKEIIESYTKPWESESSDLSFANMFIWGTEGKMTYALKDNMLFVKFKFKGVPEFFWAPIPKKGTDYNYREGICDAFNYLIELGVEPTLRSVSEPFYEMVKASCPDLFSMSTDIASDYVYEREKLASLSGKKLHSKRNHINKFLSLYPDFEYKKLDSSMIADCMEIYNQWSEEKDEDMNLSDEKKSVLLALNNLDALDLVGGTLYVDDKLIAFTVGERITSDMQLVHIEKADYSYEGAYPMINQQYVLNECEDVMLVNREEDMGIPGMRKAKRAYYPVKMVEKYMFGTRDLTDIQGLWGDVEEDVIE